MRKSFSFTLRLLLAFSPYHAQESTVPRLLFFSWLFHNLTFYASTHSCSSRPENFTRPYTIGTTFPNRTLDDDTQTIEAAGLNNSVVVQRWV
jgi:hypothetical protein